MKKSPRRNILIFLLVLCVLALGGFLYYRYGYRASFGTIGITTLPQGATVVFGDEVRGETPIEMNLQKGSYTVFITKEGYIPIEESIEVRPGVFELKGFALEEEGKN